MTPGPHCRKTSSQHATTLKRQSVTPQEYMMRETSFSGNNAMVLSIYFILALLSDVLEHIIHTKTSFVWSRETFKNS